jgi:hypothetical protein
MIVWRPAPCLRAHILYGFAGQFVETADSPGVLSGGRCLGWLL